MVNMMQMVVVVISSCLMRMMVVMMVHDVVPGTRRVLCEVERDNSELVRIGRGVRVRNDVLTYHDFELRLTQLAPRRAEVVA